MDSGDITVKFLKKFKGIIVCFLLCFVLPFFSFLIINQTFLNKTNTFSSGFTLCGVDIGSLTIKQAEEKLNNYFETIENPVQLKLTYNGNSWIYNEQDFQIKSNIHTIVEDAYKTNHKSGYFNKIKNIKKINKMGFSPEISVKYTLLNINQKIDDICLAIEKEPVNSQVTYNKNTNNFEFLKSCNGIKVDKEKLYSDIVSSLNKSNNAKVEVCSYQTYPEVTEEMLKPATIKQSTFSTSYTNSNFERKNNIKLACSSLNGFCVLPGEEFSFNNAIGQRSIDNGYKQANIIKDGEFVKGVGGGVCQVSSTLYNALLLANIDITEVHKHSLPVGYVKPALDAMVSWNTADLKFVNTTSLPIFITCNCDGKNLCFNIYGDTKSKNLEIKTLSEVVNKIPHKNDKIVPDINGMYSDKIMFKGEFFRTKYPKDGYEAKAYLEYYIDGKYSHKKQIRHSTYQPQQGVIYEGCDDLPEGMTLPKDNIT